MRGTDSREFPEPITGAEFDSDGEPDAHRVRRPHFVLLHILDDADDIEQLPR